MLQKCKPFGKIREKIMPDVRDTRLTSQSDREVRGQTTENTAQVRARHQAITPNYYASFFHFFNHCRIPVMSIALSCIVP